MDIIKKKKSLAKRREENERLRARAPVAGEFEDCSQAIQRLSESVAIHDVGSDLHRLARDCAVRLRIWGHASGATSRVLDYILKDSPGIKQHTLDLLEDLHQVVDLATTEARPQSRDDSNLASSAYLSGLDDTLEDDLLLQLDPILYLEEAIDILRNLNKLLPNLQNPLDEHDGLQAGSDPLGHTEEEFTQLAVMMFPNVHIDLARRLGHSNWCRRQNIWRLSEGQPGPGMTGPFKQSSPGTTAHWESQLSQQSERPFSKLPLAKKFTAAESDAGISSIMSGPESVLTVLHLREQDSLTTLTDNSQAALLQSVQHPECPVDLPRTGSFNCPYCRSELPLTLSSSRFDLPDWNMHIDHDLQPYICTFGDCLEPRRRYSSRSEWFQHELNFHRSPRQWMCFTCDENFQSADHFEVHLSSKHATLSPSHRLALLQHCSQYFAGQVEDNHCSICDVMCHTSEELEQHLGGHMEMYALTTLMSREHHEENNVESEMRIDEYFQSLPQSLPRTEHIPPNVCDVKGEVQTTTTMSPPIHQHEMDPIDSHSWPHDSRGAAKAGRSDNDDLAEWVEKIEDAPSLADRQFPNRYENFVGRHIDLDRIHSHLDSPGQICTISGRGGIGKTAIAIEYLHKYKSEYTDCFWIEAETPGVSAEQFGAILLSIDANDNPSVGEDARVYKTRDYLTKTDRRWLIVFDNAASWKSINRYIPRNFVRTQGSVLITTREPLFPSNHRYQNQHAVGLEPWPTDQGRQFLLSSLHPKMKMRDMEDHEDFLLADQCLRVVGGLPLAISMVVGYVKGSNTTLSDFLEIWEAKEQRKRRKRRNVDVGETDIDSTIDSLWTIGIGEVRTNSRRLLDIMSFLDPDRIQKSFLVGEHQEEYLEFLDVSGSLSYKRMIVELVGRRLISVKEASSGPVYIVHRTLKAKVLLDMEDYSFVDAFRKVFRLIRKKFPEADPQQVPNTTHWVACAEYISHVNAMHQIFSQNSASLTSLKDPTPIEIAKLFCDAGFYLWARPSSFDALSILETADRVLEAAGAESQPKLQADIQSLIGMLLLNMGVVERREGLKRLKKASIIRDQIYAVDPTYNNDVLRMNAANDYALCLLNEHEFEEAGEIFTKCHEQYLIWGPEDENPFENSKYYGNFALVYMWRGEYEKALEFQRRAINYIRQFSGKDTNSYWRKVFMLACILLQSGDMQAALDTFLEVLTSRLEMYGKHHVETILATYAVGAAYSHLDDPYTAIEYMEQCLDWVKSSKWDRAAVARAQYHLARLYKQQGINEEEVIVLEKEVQFVIDEFGEFAADCVVSSGNKMMILNDLQPTFLGRFTGLKLLNRLQAHLRDGEEAGGMGF